MIFSVIKKKIIGLKNKVYRKFFSKEKKIPINYIEKEKINNKIKCFKNSGLNEVKREKKLIISLTSFPERMYDVHFALYSLLNQSLKPDEVILWLGVEEFPNKENDIPKNILNLKENGLTIKWCKDIKSYKKLIPALKEYPNDLIVTADDDLYYSEHWLELLYNAYLQEPDYIHCHRAHRIIFDEKNKILPYNQWPHCIQSVEKSFLNFCTTGGGVLYPPNSLYKDVFNEELFLKLCPTTDDLWFWSMAVLNGTKINVVENNIRDITYINPERDLGISGEKTLYVQNLCGEANDIQLKKILDCYSQLNKIISFDSALYWEERYAGKRNSGAGSYGRLAEFKANIINDFVIKNNIDTVIEFGVGDGNQLSLLDIPNYVGYDISKTIVENTSEKFIADKTKKIKHLDEYKNEKADLSMSLDVIFHLIEDEVFDKYMRTLFSASNKYVIIYASDKDEYFASHVKHRKFSEWIKNNKIDWQLLEHIPNIYPFDENNPVETSFSDFYIYKKISV
ncbi:MAG: hypothetical protein PHC64_02880 [Candidatus Gastranaerophilales bacterium]|nr:hypothetical protein [Candidatus Gastranaerophilales bacterium]